MFSGPYGLKGWVRFVRRSEGRFAGDHAFLAHDSILARDGLKCPNFSAPKRLFDVTCKVFND